MSSESFSGLVIDFYKVFRREQKRKKAIENIKEDGRQARSIALEMEEEYPLLDIVSARLFGKRNSSLIYVYGCSSHPNMLLLISLTHEEEYLENPKNIREWLVKEVKGHHKGLDETIRYRRAEMLELAETIAKQYRSNDVSAMEAYILKNAIPDHSTDLTNYLSKL